MSDPISRIDPKYLVNLKGKMHPTYPGVLAAALEAGLRSLEVKVVQFPSAANGQLAVCEALAVFTREDGREITFAEVGDCDNENCGKHIAPHKVRMAATRAKGRALRDALGIGVALREEMSDESDGPSIAWSSTALQPAVNATDRNIGPVRHERPAAVGTGNGGKHGQNWSHRRPADPVAAPAAGHEAAADANQVRVTCEWQGCGAFVEERLRLSSVSRVGMIVCREHAAEAKAFYAVQAAEQTMELTVSEPAMSAQAQGY